MKKRNWMNLGFAGLAFLTMGIASGASAEERLFSSNFAREFRGETVIDLGHELQFSGMRGMLNSVVVIASSKRGNGQVELFVDGMVIERKILGTRLESEQFFVMRELWPRTRDVTLRFKGNIEIAFLGATIDDQFGNGYPEPRPDPRPNPRPEPRPPRPLPPPVPGPTQPQLLSDYEFNSFIRELQGRPFDSDKDMLVQQYAGFWVNRLMSMQQLSIVLSQFRFDDGRLSAVRTLDRIVLVDVGMMQLVLSKFDFEHNRDQARRILKR